MRELAITKELSTNKSFLSVSNQVASLEADGKQVSSVYLGCKMYNVSALAFSQFKRAVQAETKVQLLVAAIAIKRYQLKYGETPPSLTALVPDILTELPIDYFDGKPLRYKKTGANEFRLWSVGENFRDDGGNADGYDTRRRWEQGDDLVWLQPATPEEVSAYLDAHRPVNPISK